MSWDGYVNTSLIGTGSIDQAVIYSADGAGLWAGSAGFAGSQAELGAINSAYNDKSEPKKLTSEGFSFAGKRYVVIKADERSIYGIKGKEGLIIVKSKQAMLIAHHSPPVTTQAASTIVENLADYLIENGY